ncbi:hypothetical protein UlMin_017364 [Ulmus minor]
MASHTDSYNAGVVKGQTEEKAKQMIGSVGDKAQEAKEWTVQTAQAAKEKAEQATEPKKEPGILQQTGEQVKQMAIGATDAVKSTLGVGKN